MKNDINLMAWNEPGKDSSEKPRKQEWRQSSQNGPPDLDKIFKDFMKKFNKFMGFSSNNSSNKGGASNYIIFILLVVVYILSGIYIVEPAQKAAILRFGKYVRTAGPGPHWLPRFIENKVVVDVENIRQSKHVALMLTKEENIVNVEIEVQYKVDDLEDYLFNVTIPDNMLKQAADSALRQVVGSATLDFVLTEGRNYIETEVQKLLEYILDSYSAGIKVITVAMQPAKAPDEVKSAFDDVIKAREIKEQLRHAAEAYANDIVPRAKGRAHKIIKGANAYSKEKIAEAYGDVAKFNQLLPEYKKAPALMENRMYLETIEKIMANNHKVIVDLPNNNNLMYLPIDKMLNNSNSNEGSDNEN